MNYLAFDILPVVILLATTALITTWGIYIPRGDGRLEATLSTAGFGLLVLFLVWAVLVTAGQKQIPILNPGQLMLLLAMMSWVGYSLIQVHSRQKLLSLLPLTAILVLTLLALFSGLEPPANPSTRLQGFNPAFHVILAMAGTSLLVGTGVFAAGELILHRQLKRKHFGAWFEKLPSMREMNAMRTVSLIYGWIVLTIIMIIASFRLISTIGTGKIVVSHFHPMLTLWILAGLLVVANRRRMLPPLKLAVASLVLSVVMVSLVTISLIEIFRGKFL